jgi:RNA polymerase sigma-70 factor (ECF subfamily)
MEPWQIFDLVCKAQDGDREAFGQLVKQFETSVFAIALRRLRNRTEAMELTQDVFVQAYRKLHQLREPERFAGWLKRITIRLAINRAVRRPPEHAQDPAVLGARNGPHVSPLDALLTGERKDQVRNGLERLRDLDRKTLLAFYFEGQSLIEMSDRFASPIGTIKRRLHTARIRLRDELLQHQPV